MVKKTKKMVVMWWCIAMLIGVIVVEYYAIFKGMDFNVFMALIAILLGSLLIVKLYEILYID